jgi:hypothetical protein
MGRKGRMGGMGRKAKSMRFVVALVTALTFAAVTAPAQ